MSAVLRDDALAGQVVLVTGGGTGIGRAIALACAGAGARVAVCGRRREALDEVATLVADRGGEGLALPGDVREPEQVRRLVDEALAAYDRVDVLVNGAGGQFLAPAEDISVNGWRSVHRLAVESAWSVTRQVATRSMIPNRSGLVVFIAFSPRRGIPGMVHATTARAAVENLAAGLALEWSRYGIRSVAVAPGTILTEGLRAQYPQDAIDGWTRAVPLGRLGTPEEIGELVAFLATPAASYVTGTTVVADGGVDAWGTGRPALTEKDTP